MSRSFFLMLCMSLGILFPISVEAWQNSPVEFKPSLIPIENQEDQFELTVSLDIEEGWHTYGEVEDGSGTATTIQLELPTGARQKGDWDRPFGEEKEGATGSTIYEGEVEFSCTIVVSDKLQGNEIGVEVGYQACTSEYCNPPTTKSLTVKFPEEAMARKNLFATPVRLMIDGKPLDARTRFPSPAIYDVDDDGVDELVVGGLSRTIAVFENSNESGKGDPVWGDFTPMKNGDGKSVRISNW